MIVSLTQYEWEYFSLHVLSALDGRLSIEHSNRTQRYQLDFTENVAEAIVDLCTQRFIQFGRGDNDEPNAEGLFVERLLDKFNPAS